MRIQHNISALNAHRQMTNNNSALSKNLEKLSSGYRINSAADDAAGLAISEKMRAQITGLETASKNAADGISLIQTAEGNLQEVHTMLNRMTELATQSANGTFDDETDRANLQKEYEALKTEINRVSKSANFNGINLLDGNLANNSAVSIESETISSTAGVTLEQGTNGAGTKGEFVIDLSSGLFGSGDSLTLKGTDSNGAAINGGGGVTFTFTNGKTPAAGEFTGATAQEQAESLAAAMKGNANIGGNFDISVDGGKVVLTAIKEGTGTSTITSVATEDKKISASGSETDAAVAGTACNNMGWDSLFGSGADGTGTGYHLSVGDVVTFNFDDGYGNTLTAEVEITDDMIYAGGGDPAQGELTLDEVTENVVNKLKETAFKDIEGTAQNESNLKVSDMFTVTANKTTAAVATGANGSIHVAGVAGSLGEAGNVTIKRGDNTMTATPVSSATGTGASGDTAQEYTLAVAGTDNYSAGDVVTINGKLSDGSDFKIDMKAGEDFEIGAAVGDSLDNIAAALNGGKVDVVVSSGGKSETVKSDTLFGANKNFDAVAVNSGTDLVFTSNAATAAGKGIAGAITSVDVVTPTKANAQLSKNLATAQGYASSSIEISKDMKYGSAIKVGDTTFEVVADANDVSNKKNQAIVIADMEKKSAEEITKAIGDAISSAKGFTAQTDYNNDGTVWDDTDAQKAKEAGLSYSVAVEGNKVTISSLDKGSSANAPEISAPYGDKINVKNVKFDTNKLAYGDTISIDGKTYEFVENAKDAKDGNTAVQVDLSTADGKAVAQALADVAKGVKATVSEDGTLTIQAMADADGKVGTTSVISENDGLTLQVGETAEDFQKVNVKIRAVNTESLGLDNVDIANQDNAAAAIDVIKNAINSVSSTRGDLGALQNRLEHTINNLDTTNQNMTEAESRIRDVDMAAEMMAFTKNNILLQASQSMLAQANQLPQGVLQLLQ